MHPSTTSLSSPSTDTAANRTGPLAALSALAPLARSPRVPGLPALGSVDSTVALLREGYAFGSRRFDACRSDVFTTRLALRPAVFAYGADAAAQLYGGEGTTRRRSLPVPTLSLLLDVGSVEMLEGPRHRARKAMFLSLMRPEDLTRIGELFERALRERLPRWQAAGRVVLLDELHGVLCEAVCAWSGLELDGAALAARTAELAAMVDGAGSVGLRNVRGHVLRRRCERWARETVDRVRAGGLSPAPGTALHTIAWHREDGALLSREVAAVELINVLRPTVAVARFVVFAALALHDHPEQRERVAHDDEHLTWFVQEVRRVSPFFPLVAARLTEDRVWRGAHLRRGTWLLLDVWATDHDPRTWDDPRAFRPERFRDGDGGAFGFVPQGGGEHATSHRCAGEWLTVELLRRAVRLLTTAVDYDVPPQDLGVALSRMPARPRSGLVLSGVRVR